MISTSKLHHYLLTETIEKGFLPGDVEMANALNVSAEVLEQSLRRLSDEHGVHLHPNTSRVWAIHPFSLAPTNFIVKSEGREWFGNCAWCSLGIAELLEGDATIQTTVGANQTEPVEIRIAQRTLINEDYVVHFPVPMVKAWDNVAYTCSVMLLFRDEAQVLDWCERHGIAKGDVQPIAAVWELAKRWYGNHLNPDWVKWSIPEARAIFESLGLTHPVWELPESESRF